MVGSADLSERIGYLIRQQRLAYNQTVETCLAVPADEHLPTAFTLYNCLTAWRRDRPEFEGPSRVHRAGVSAAREAVDKWRKANFVKAQRRQRTGKPGRWSDPQSLYRSRKVEDRGRAPLYCLAAPRRVDDRTIALPGCGRIQIEGVLPDDMRSFQLVDVTDKITRRTTPRTRKYKLHVQCRLDNPDSNVDGPVKGCDMGIVNTVTICAIASDNSISATFHNPPLSAIRRKGDRVDQLRAQRDRHQRKARRYRRVGRKMQREARRIVQRQQHWERLVAKAIAHDASLVAVEALKLKNMSRSARGTQKQPGKGVAQKRGLNRGLHYSRLGCLRERIKHTCENTGAHYVEVSPQFTIQTCGRCGYQDPGNRESQAEFRCLSCGHIDHADANAAFQIAYAGWTAVDISPRRLGQSSSDTLYDAESLYPPLPAGPRGHQVSEKNLFA